MHVSNMPPTGTKSSSGKRSVAILTCGSIIIHNFFSYLRPPDIPRPTKYKAQVLLESLINPIFSENMKMAGLCFATANPTGKKTSSSVQKEQIGQESGGWNTRTVASSPSTSGFFQQLSYNRSLSIYCKSSKLRGILGSAIT